MLGTTVSTIPSSIRTGATSSSVHTVNRPGREGQHRQINLPPAASHVHPFRAWTREPSIQHAALQKRQGLPAGGGQDP